MKQTPGHIPLDDSFAAARQATDALCSSIGLLGGEENRRILFVSPQHGEGTTSLVTATALSLARNLRERVALIEANYFTPGMARYLDLPDTPGITDYLDGESTAEQSIRNSKVPGLYVLTAGSNRAPISGEFSSRAFRLLLEDCGDQHRFTLIDAPPLLAHPDSRILLQHADMAVLVLRARSTRTQEAQAAIRLIQDAGVELLGTVLNRFRFRLPFGLGGSEAP